MSPLGSRLLLVSEILYKRLVQGQDRPEPIIPDLLVKVSDVQQLRSHTNNEKRRLRHHRIGCLLPAS